MEKQHAEENLQYIRQMLEETRRSVTDNGMHYIIWSIMPALGIIGTYFVLLTDRNEQSILWIWVMAVAIGWILSFRYGSRGARSRPFNFMERTLSSVWVCAGITMTIVAFGGMLSESFSPQVIPALIAAIMGVPTYMAGLVYESKGFQAISAGWWAAALVFFFWNSFHTLAALGVLMVLFQAIPGIFLYTQSKKLTNAGQ